MTYKLIKALVCAVVVSSTLPAYAVDNVDAARSEIARVKKTFAPDRRQAIFDVTAMTGKDNIVVIDGKVSEQWLADTLINALSNRGVNVKNSIEAYPDDQWVMPRISVACLRQKPGHEQEMASQALMGMPLRVLETYDDWYRVQTPDGYLSWVTSSSVVPYTDKQMRQWRDADRYVVTTPYQTRAYYTSKATGLRDVVSDLVLGNIVVALDKKPQNGRLIVELPDGRQGWVDKDDVTPIREWASQDFDPQLILDVAYSMEGTPYLWGGTSVKTLDCSGLAKTSYLANGIILMRDASQQALTGTRIEAADWKQCRSGDLLFFGNAVTRKVTHVAIYDSDGKYVHSSGRVKRNSVDPASQAYLTTPFLHAVRIDGNQGTPGITRAINHPWYFNK